MRTHIGIQPQVTARRLSTGVRPLAVGLLVATLAAGSLPAPPVRAEEAGAPSPPAAPAAPAETAAIQQEIEALKQRIEALEQQLAAIKRTPTAAPVAADALRARNGSRFQVSGYTQIRFTNIGSQASDRAPNNVTDFQVARFRPRFSYRFDDHFLAALELSAATRGAGSLAARDAYLEYARAGRWGYLARAGQQKIPFGWEVFREGNEARAALERARIFGILFPDERDIGLVVATAPRSPRAPVISIGAVNGDGVNKTDGDKAKSFAANAIVPLGSRAVLGGSVYTGTTTAAMGGKLVSQVKNAYGVENRLALGRLSTQLEYVWGRAAGADLSGGYGQLDYDTGQRGHLFARFDVFDPNEHAARDYWSRTSLGWYKDFTRQFRLTGEYDLITNRALGSHPHANEFGVQVQGSF